MLSATSRCAQRPTRTMVLPRSAQGRQRHSEHMSSIHIRCAVDSIRADSTSIYTPVIEPIVNGIQAIAAAPAAKPGEMEVTVLCEGVEDLIERIRGRRGLYGGRQWGRIRQQ